MKHSLVITLNHSSKSLVEDNYYCFKNNNNNKHSFTFPQNREQTALENKQKQIQQK